MISSTSGQNGLTLKLKMQSVYRTLPYGSAMSSRDPRVRRHLEVKKDDPTSLLEKLKTIMEILKPSQVPLPPDSDDDDEEEIKIRPSEVPLPQDSDSDSDSSTSPSSSSSSCSSTSSTSISSSDDEDEDVVLKSFSGILFHCSQASTSYGLTKPGSFTELVHFGPKHRGKIALNGEDEVEDVNEDDDDDEDVDGDEVTLLPPPVPYTGKGKGISTKRWSVDQLAGAFSQMSLQDCPLSSSFGKLTVSRKRKAPQDEMKAKKQRS